MKNKKMLSALFAPNRPFPTKNWPFFYGWVILGCMTVGIISSIPGQTIGVGVFNDYLIEELKLSRLTISIAYMIGTLVSSFFIPYGGRLFDRYGARKMIMTAAIAMGLTLFYLSACDLMTEALTDLTSPALGPVCAFILLAIGFFMLRLSGQGILTMSSRNLIGLWFNRLRGRASAISALFVSLFFGLAPWILMKLITALTWRGAWLAMGIVAVVLLPVLAWIFVRDKPEDCGLLMDGDSGSKKDDKQDSRFKILKEFTLQEAKRDYGFWILVATLAFHGLFLTAFTFHITSIGDEMGMTAVQAVGLFIPMSFINVGANVFSGWLSDYIRLKYLVLIECLACLIGMIGLFSFIPTELKYLFIAIGFGISGGVWGTLANVSFPKYYGRENLGSISGFNMSCVVAGSAIGPAFFALSHQLSGSYQAAIFLSLIIPAATLIGCMWMENPQNRVSD